jgi:hypothetical protein
LRLFRWPMAWIQKSLNTARRRFRICSSSSSSSPDSEELGSSPAIISKSVDPDEAVTELPRFNWRFWPIVQFKG